MLRKFTLALLSMLLVPLAMMAQNVTISPTSGDMLAGVSDANQNESGKLAGFYSTWMHKQLALTVNTSDGPLLVGGDIADPACTLTTTVRNDNKSGNLVVANGRTQTFMVVSLPKGYRITKYEITMAPVAEGTNLLDDGFPSGSGTGTGGNAASNFGSMGSYATCFYETNAWDPDFQYYASPNTSATSLNEGQYLAVAASGDDKVMNPSSDTGKTFIITRTAKYNETKGEWDMDNRLYFWVGKEGDYYALEIKSFEIWFTAEGTFDAGVSPTTVGSATNYVKSPFTTSKHDLGAVTYNEAVGRFVYSYSNVRDVVGYTHLYQADAVAEGATYPTVGASTDNTIYPLLVDGDGHYAFGNNTYYIEPPVDIETATGAGAPIGFRVVGVTFKTLWGTETEATTKTYDQACYVYRSSQESGIYLTENLLFKGTSGNNGTRATWQVDEYDNLYIGEGDYKKYLACFGSGDVRSLSLSSAATGDNARWNLKRNSSDGRLYYLSDGGNYYWLYAKSVKVGNTTSYQGFVIKEGASTSGYTAVYSTTPTGGKSINIPAFKPSKYTIKVYDKTGTSVLSNGTITVENESDAKDSDGKWLTYEFNDFNNDAVKFTVENVESGKQALFDVTLKLEALNPYIDRMSVVCSEPTSNLRITQNFTASDFGVSGGAFHFNLPSIVGDKDVYITFEDLYSHYGDETYGNAGHARYSFVSSPYFSAFDGVANNKIAPTKPAETLNWNDDATTDAGLYDTRYVGTASNAQPGAAIPKTHKIYAGVAGDKEFKFNNAAEVQAGTATGNVLIEYPFSVERYLASTSTSYPGGATGTGGKFEEIVMSTNTESTNYNVSDTYYLFTADETRYNIAPSTAWQHRSYAYYTMAITLETATYSPEVKFVPIYSQTYYNVIDAETGKETNVTEEKPFYGVRVTAVDSDGEAGYADTKQIFTIIAAAVGQGENGTATGTAKDENEAEVGTWTGWEKGLESSKQLLYLDFSELAGIFQVTTDEQQSMEDYSATNAKNCMIFLPVGATAPNDNVAFKTSSGSFTAAQNIVLTDKQPFYSPYDIHVDAQKEAQYTRVITVEKYKDSNLQSLILPFELSLTNGVHNNSFKVTTLKAPAGTYTGFAYNEEDECETAEFEVVSGSVAAANTPYMIDILGGNTTFVIAEKGATIKATTGMNESDYMFYGDAVTLNYTDKDNVTTEHSFTPRGFYAGKVYDATKDDFRGDNVFFYYGSKNMFRSSAALNSSYSKLKAYPFRAFYGYQGPAGAKALKSFMFTYGSDEVNGISELTKRLDFAVRSGKGYLEITSGKDANVRISNLGGMLIDKEQMMAGETRIVNVPAGVYIVNGVKIIVK